MSSKTLKRNDNLEYGKNCISANSQIEKFGMFINLWATSKNLLNELLRQLMPSALVDTILNSEFFSKLYIPV